MKVFDGLVNLVANLGTARDKASANTYVYAPLTEYEVEVAYRDVPLARRIVDMPAEDAFREWREWQAEADQITAIEEEEDKLRVQWNLINGQKAARLWGGAAIYIGVKGVTDTGKPLDPRTVRLGGLEYLAIISKRELAAGEIQRDPRLSGFGRPSYYTMATGLTGVGSVRVHPSRLVLLAGEEVPSGSSLDINQGWGDSVLNGVLDSVKRVDATAGSIASLVFEAKVDVLKVKNFMRDLASRGQAYADEWQRRNALIMAAKGINGTLMIDGEDDYQQKSANFAGLPEVLVQFMQISSSAAQIPMTLLFGMSPGGLNATGDADIRGYYDRIKVMQNLEIKPATHILTECLIRSALGDRPPEIFYNWRSLWQQTQKEKAEVGKLLAETLVAADGLGAISPEALGKALVNGLTECGAFPGLEAADAEFPNDFEEELAPPVVPDVIELEQAEPGQPVADAAPRTLYVRRDVVNRAEISTWARAQGFTDIVPDLHVTIAYSTAPVDWFKVGVSYSDKLELPAGGPRQMDRLGTDGKYIALLITANELVWRHDEILRAGASWSWPDYQPHISIQIGGEVDLDSVEPYRGRIVFGPEIFEEVKE